MKPVPRPARNQRVSNARQRKAQHLLDVKIRVSKERTRRTRAIVSGTAKLLFFCALVAGAWVGGKEALRRFVWENPDYFLRDVQVSTDGTLTREQVLAAGGIFEGRNIFTVDLGKARAAIEKLPQVETAEVQRMLPARVTVNITERRPIAWVTARSDEDPSVSDRSFLIDARGMALKSRVLLPEYLHLPVISGVETENLVAGQRVTSFEMQSAIDLVRINADSTRFQARNIDLSKGYCLVVTDQKRAKITFGLDGIEEQLSRLNKYLDKADEARQALQTVNLIVRRNTPVTFYEPEAEVLETAAGHEPPSQDPKARTKADAPSVKTKPAGKSSRGNNLRKPFRDNG